MAEMYKILPSQIMAIDDEYTAYCFNEACANIRQHQKNGDAKIHKKAAGAKSYGSFSAMYEDILN